MNKLVKKSNRRNLKSTKKSNRKLNKKSNRKNLRNSKLNKKSNRKNLNKKGGRGPIPFIDKDHGYDCLCVKKNQTIEDSSPEKYAQELQDGGSRKSLRKNKSKKQSNLKKKLNRKGGDGEEIKPFQKKPLQLCECKSGKRSEGLGDIVKGAFVPGTDRGDNLIKNCDCIPITKKSEYNDNKSKIDKLFDAITKIKESASAAVAPPAAAGT